MGFMAPLGRSLSLRYMFNGEVNMWRSIVVGKITRKATKAPTCSTHIDWCQPDRCPAPSKALASGYPMNDHFS
jgi:hypothetical protein